MTGTCTDTKRHIKFDFFKTCRVDVSSLDHTCNFSCCDREINVWFATCIIKNRNFSFLLLSNTRHYRYTNYVLRINTKNVCIVCLCNRSEHLLWWLWCRKLIYEVWVERFTVTNPCRTAWCEHWELSSVISMCKLMNEFICFFHDCKVSCEVCIEYIIYAHFLKCSTKSLHWSCFII